MGTEIERKFLVKDNSWRALAAGTNYRQGYLNSAKERTVRVRTIDEKGFFNDQRHYDRGDPGRV